jgi:hypothetical protein
MSTSKFDALKSKMLENEGIESGWEFENLTDKIATSVLGGVDGNTSCSNSGCTNPSCTGDNNPTNSGCKNTSCNTAGQNNSTCTNTGCSNIGN